MSSIPTDIPTNVTPAETAGVARAPDPAAAAEPGSFGQLLQRVQSPAKVLAEKPAKSDDADSTGQVSKEAEALLQSDSCFAVLEGDELLDNSILVMSDLPELLPETSDGEQKSEDAAKDEDKLTHTDPLALLLAQSIVVTSTSPVLVSKAELTTENASSEMMETGSEREEKTSVQTSVLVTLPTSTQPEAQDRLRRVDGKPISIEVDSSVQTSAAATSPIVPPANVTDTEVPTLTVIASEAIIIDPSMPVATSEEIAPQFPFKQAVHNTVTPAKKKVADSPRETPSVIPAEPDKNPAAIGAKVPEDTQPDSLQPSERPTAKVAPPTLEPTSASMNVFVPAQPSLVISADDGSGKRPRSVGSQNEAPISASAPTAQSTSQGQPSQVVPTDERAPITPLPSPAPPEPKSQPQSLPTGGRLNEVERVRFVQRVARAVQSAVERGGEIRLRLSPPELGSLMLEVIVREGVMNARLETETTTTRTILLDNLPALRDRLAEQNVKIDRFDVDVRDGSAGSLPDQTAKQADAEAQRGGAGRGKTRLADPLQTEVKTQAIGPRVVGQGQFNVVV